MAIPAITKVVFLNSPSACVTYCFHLAFHRLYTSAKLYFNHLSKLPPRPHQLFISYMKQTNNKKKSTGPKRK